jgi:molybdenum cofactor cytidylyltransferase
MAATATAGSQPTLSGALSLGRRELVSLVGAGGKTSALRRLAEELAAAGARVIATTTTAMLMRELTAVGPLVMEASDTVLIAELREALRQGRAVGAARAPGTDGKVVGLPPATIDRLWAEGLADYVLVEADGSRGLPLKAFAPDEPQVPDATSTIVAVAGLDAIGSPLGAEHVHRAEALAATLGVPLGAALTPWLFVSALREQLRQLWQRWPAPRVLVLLNKADGRAEEALGGEVAREVLAGVHVAHRAPPAADRECPDAVIVASLRRGRFARFTAAEDDRR